MQYRLTILDPQTGQQREELLQAAANETETVIRARYQQAAQIVLRIEPVRALNTGRGHHHAALSFCQELKVLLESGLNVVEAIDTLASRTDRSLLTQIYQQLRDTLRSGRTLSLGLQAYPHIFPEFFVASVQASEQTGNLTLALERFISYRERLDELRSRVVSAALYPTIVLIASALVMLFLIGYVIPRFSVIFTDMQDRLPLLTRGLLSLGLELANHPTQWASGCVTSVVVLIWALRQASVRGRLVSHLNRYAIIKHGLLQYALARLYRTLAMLIEAGIPFVTAMHMSRAVLPEYLQPMFNQTVSNIESGQAIASSFHAQQLTDNITNRILQAGERSGSVAASFNNMARFIEQKLTYRIDRLARILEPLILLLVGSLIGLIVVLMYSPIFELASTIQ